MDDFVTNVACKALAEKIYGVTCMGALLHRQETGYYLQLEFHGGTTVVVRFDTLADLSVREEIKK